MIERNKPETIKLIKFGYHIL